MVKRINVTISETMNEKLDKYSEKYGVTKSSIVGFVLGQWVDSMETMNSAVFGATGKPGFLEEIIRSIAVQSDNIGKQE